MHPPWSVRLLVRALSVRPGRSGSPQTFTNEYANVLQMVDAYLTALVLPSASARTQVHMTFANAYTQNAQILFRVSLCSVPSTTERN